MTHPLIVAALLLLQVLAPDAYALVSRYEIQAVSEWRPYAGMALCKHGIIVIVLPQTADVWTAAGNLAHEATHLKDDCPTYNHSGEEAFREAAAYRYQVRVLRAIEAPPPLQEWVMNRYWKYWWREHRGLWGLGILP